MPLGLTNLYSPCNPVTTNAPCNHLYQDLGYTIPAAAGVYVISNTLYFVGSNGLVTGIQNCPGPCGFNGPDCTIKNNIQCNVITTVLGVPTNTCTNFKAACCACISRSSCIP
jgi:hypothetical protein